MDRPAILRLVDPRICSALPWLGDAVALLIVACAIVWPSPVEHHVLPGADHASDLPLSHWTSATIIDASLETDGRFPLWDHTFAGGRPVAADPLAALWYPPTQLLRVMSVESTLRTTIPVHLFLAGAGVLLLAPTN